MAKNKIRKQSRTVVQVTTPDPLVSINEIPGEDVNPGLQAARAIGQAAIAIGEEVARLHIPTVDEELSGWVGSRLGADGYALQQGLDQQSIPTYDETDSAEFIAFERMGEMLDASLHPLSEEERLRQEEEWCNAMLAEQEEHGARLG